MNNYKWALCAAVAVLSYGCGDALPSRSECISEVVLALPVSYLPTEIEEFNGKLAMTIMGEAQKQQIPLAGFTYPSVAEPIMYFQYKSGCMEKEKYTHMLLDIEGFPLYSISNRKVVPGASTIAVNGQSWSDGMEEIVIDAR